MIHLERLEAWIGEAKHFPKFAAFHRANPHVFDAFCAEAKEALRRQYSRIGAHLFIQMIRWSKIDTERVDEFKISNTHFPFYARLFVLAHPEAASLFVLKKLHDDYGCILPHSATIP